MSGNGRFGVPLAALLLAVAVSLWLWPVLPRAQSGAAAGPAYRVDPFWPKPLPAMKGADGQSRQWVTGEVGASCIDSHDHIVTVNRGFLRGGLLSQEGSTSVPAPPVLIFDPQGNIVQSWGDATLTPEGAAARLPNGIHGCHVDHEDDIWLAGNADGVVQKWSHDGSRMLLQIGTKGQCDGSASRPTAPYPTCGEPGHNTSRSLLNGPADVAVDPNPDPANGQRGSVYVADGYGNYRIVVFDAKGNYLRQWGSPGAGPGQFVQKGGGHPHCVELGKDGLVYACDRGQNRIHVFDRLGALKRTISVDPPDQIQSTNRVTDIAFSSDAGQRLLFVTDLGSNRVWILDRERGMLVGGIGRSGHLAGEFTFPHTVAIDSQGNLYVAETIGGRRSQKFVPSGG